MNSGQQQQALEGVAQVPQVLPSNDALKSDIPDPTPDLLNRLDNWKHSVGLLEGYVQSLIATQKSNSAGYEKSRKAINDVPRFDYADGSRPSSAGADTGIGAPPAGSTGTGTGAGVGAVSGEKSSVTQPTGPVGIAEAFAAMRTRTEYLLNKSNNTEQQLRSAILPQLDTLKGDIDRHYKGLKGPGLKGMKEVDKAKAVTQKHIEALAQGTASYGSLGAQGSKADARADPYIKHRLVLNAVHDQVNKENNQSDAVLSMQNNFRTLETHIIQVLQQAVSVLEQIMRGWGEAQSEAFLTTANYFNHINKDHEWNRYVKAHSDILVPEGMPKRQANNITFANMDHAAVKPVMEGPLLRKGTVMKQYHTGYYVLTPSGYLHEFKSQDHIQDPEPERSLYVPGCSMGPVAPRDAGKFKFSLQGKDLSKSLSTKHTFVFKTTTYEEMMAWHQALEKMASSQSGPVGSTVGTAGGAAGGAAAANAPTDPNAPTGAQGLEGAAAAPVGATGTQAHTMPAETHPIGGAQGVAGDARDINTGMAAGSLGVVGGAGNGESELYESHQRHTQPGHSAI